MKSEENNGTVIVRLEDDVLFEHAEAFAAAVESAVERGGELVIVNPTERIRRLCRITRLDFVVPILADEPSALARAHAPRETGCESPGQDAGADREPSGGA